MQNIEIKIWANPQGFVELTKKLPSELFAEDEKAAFNPDGNFTLVAEDYFSIFFGHNSYVVTFHILLSNRKLRHPRTIFSLAIRRGYKLNNLIKEFADLRAKYEDLLNNQISDINELKNGIIRSVPNWMDALNAKLIADDTQPFININAAEASISGYVSYSSAENLNGYLSNPVRTEYRGYRIVMILPENVIQQNSAFLRDKMITGINAAPVYNPQYDIWFPDYDPNKPIKTVRSLQEGIDLPFTKPNCKPIRLTGLFLENMSEWNIRMNDDKTGYVIGLKFEEERKVCKVYVRDCKSDEEIGNPTSFLLTTGLGRLMPTADGCELELKGKDIELFFQSQAVLKDRFRIKQVDTKTVTSYKIECVSIMPDSSIVIKVSKVFLFYVSQVRREIEKKYPGIEPVISVIYGNSESTVEFDKLLDGEMKDYQIRICDKSKIYKDGDIIPMISWNNYHLERNSCKLELPQQDFTYKDRCNADGFEHKQPSETNNPASEDVDSKKNPSSQTGGAKWKLFIAGILLGLIVGVPVGIVVDKMLLQPKPQQEATVIGYNPGTGIANPQEAAAENPEGEDVGANRGDAEGTDASSGTSAAPGKVAKSGQTSEPEAQTDQKIGQKSEQKSAGQSDGGSSEEMEFQELISPLNGLDYDWGKYDGIVKKAKDRGMYQKNEKFFKDREMILRLCREDRTQKRYEGLKEEYNKMTTLSEEQDEALKKIIYNGTPQFDEDYARNAYTSVGKVKNLKELLEKCL